MRLPPLNAIRAFEVAARHGSFTRAADELCVTPGAISRQVRSLEDYLQKPLFTRSYRDVTLTEPSQRYAASLTQAFRQMRDSTREFLSATDVPTLTIYSPITLTLYWLVRRLASYHALNPEQGIRISSEGQVPVELAGTDIDIALRIAGADGDLRAIRLFDIELTAVCSPAFLGASGVTRPEDLLKHSLLVSERRPRDWRNWFRAAGVGGDETINELPFQSSAMAYQAAMNGLGFAVVIRELAAEALAKGSLVAPFDVTYRDGSAFHAVFPASNEDNPAIRGFLDWIAAQAAGQSPMPVLMPETA